VLGPDIFGRTASGWAVPTATDIAFAYLIGRMVFGAAHPAIHFLLLLAIADDAVGLVILALFYPAGDLAPAWLLLSAGAVGAVFVLFNWLPRRLDRHDQRRRHSTWVRRKLHAAPYVLAGAVSWYAFLRAGLHPALALLPVIPAIPFAERPFGIFRVDDALHDDLLHVMQRSLRYPVDATLFLFGLVNAGIVLTALGPATWLVLSGLLVGKPLGIFAFGWIAAGPLRLGLPVGMRTTDLAVVGCVAGVGFTVSLFVASVAFDPGAVQDAAKMGALMSLAAAALALLAGRIGRVKRTHFEAAA
jgi:NhaA family Na+:H+ antiporter